MSGFTALNVEPEDTFEDEVDDTKEIQLEEAFKLYQNALKLHSQGPQYFQEALDAYHELLQSEVLKYPEALSDYGQDETEDDQTAGPVQADPATVPLLPSSAADSSASSVPQLLYLTFKNRGQFVLDVARHELPNKKGSEAETCRYYAKSCSESIRNFAKALERDDSDLDLWKKAARVADVLSSQRVARFCLESVLAGDDEDTEPAIDLSGLDEAFAAGELEEVIELLQDDLSRLRRSDVKPKDKLLAALRNTNDPYPFLPNRSKTLEYLDDCNRPQAPAVSAMTLNSTDYLSLGHAIEEAILGIQDGHTKLTSTTTIKVEIPSLASNGDTRPAPAISDADGVDVGDAPKEDRVMQDVAMSVTENPSIAHPHADQVSSPDKYLSENVAPREQAGQAADGVDDENTIEVLSAAPAVRDDTAAASRKRSSTVAGNEEPEGRTKSKRLRARESLIDLAGHEDETVHEDSQVFSDQLVYYQQADQAAFDVINSLLAKFDLKLHLSAEEAKQSFWQGITAPDKTNGIDKDVTLLNDFRNALMNWSDEKSQALLQGHGSQDFVEKSTGMTLFLQHSKTGSMKGNAQSVSSNEGALLLTVKRINVQQTNIYDAAYYWLLSALSSTTVGSATTASSYMTETWPEEMKTTIVQLAMATDSYLHERLRQSFSSLVHSTQGVAIEDSSTVSGQFTFVQTLFEIHLDIYAAITNPSSQVNHEARTRQGDRLTRWASLADDFMHLYIAQHHKSELTDPLILRFIWTSTTYATLAEEVDKTHVLLCLEDLKALLQRADAPPVLLPNSAAMPVISVEAVDQEISRLSTLDFFTGVFDSDNSDPVAVIEKLEPILETSTRVAAKEPSELDMSNKPATQEEQLIKFLESGDAALRLFLWRRLQNAYTAISYTPRVISCLLRAIETCLNELYTTRHRDLDESSRQISTLKWLRDIDELMVKVLVKLNNEPRGFECVDDAHLNSSLKTVTAIVKVLYGFVIHEDSIRVGQTSPPQLKGAASTKSYDKSKDRLKEMLVRAWTLQYFLVKEATVQDPASYARSADDLAEYLCTVHHSLGIRHYCKYANKSFVKLVKNELGSLKTEQDYSADMAQVFFDLYQLRFAVGIGDMNHVCPTENMDKKTAWSLIPTVMHYVEKLNIKDLIKSELKGTIEKVQQALGTVKSTPSMSYNKRIISAYLKSSVNANELFRCIRGIGDLPTRAVHSDTQDAASSGWYFLLGHMSLAKYKSAKRVTPTPTDELDIAASFFRQDLDHDIDKWETWYRLAQVYEAKIEDDLIWNSTKLNDSRSDIALLERQAIHCYIMSTAIAMRSADDTPGTAQKIQEMFAEFATRLYASSRPPLNMEAYKTDKHMRHMSSILDQTMSKQPYHTPIGEYSLWHFAAYLLSRKLTDKSKPWTTHYTHAKCLWKMFRHPENRGRIVVEDVIDSIVEAIHALPLKKDKSNEPLLEPHFKLVSIIHKMVKLGALTPTQGQEYMQATRYAVGVHLPEDEQGVDWETYILDILHKLEHADKSNWHHRITARAAHVLYDDDPTLAGALGAKHEFTKQIFTKTMTLQVWKPENERPGRHYVYTGQYVAFFVHLLEQLSDRANLDQLVRRIRRKTTDFLDHGKVWEEVVTAFVRSLRRLGKIAEGRERALFDGMNHEEFTKKSEQLETWSHDPDTSSIYLDIMKDAIDLKRLNNSLMKGPLIDDLIGDSYASLYDEYLKQLPPEEQPRPQTPPFPQGTFINMTTDLAAGADADAERARLSSMLRAQGDGAPDGPLAVSISAPVGLGLQNSPQPPSTTTGPSEIQSAPARPGRTKTVTRREIQRKAEAAIVKPPPIKTPILGKRPIVEIPARATHEESPFDRRMGDVKEEGAEGSKASSRRGSVQDSADGEADGEDNSGSELSELDDMDDEKKQLLTEFEKAQEQVDGNEADEEGDGDGDDAGDEEESNEDKESDQQDEEMAGAAEEVEIQDSQEVKRAPETPAEDEEPDFHEARE
ncbi:Histone transcription regulator 3 [Elasticomyces elasticus]|uniref:Histone transcription regulator 3 homolog n=1 Tax=Exophiala sideris TaxID=1016849 RepID=A0ABR0J609_9EURO|nr:Histone transcription regulator 3 [Elasticomyces elasticus]KAK5028331.1 Histone transcription regulator 3 [Exophiala sideris]KAK5057062.1 Histone transcription regulator 3 [Exophiala sideris]KAK5181469.1 Histone transcription regulator 3 [Eurotiomycetes sp. CCFEE 6388]